MNKNLLKRIVLTSAIAVLGVSTSFAALVMERDQSVDTAPSVGMYRFEVPVELQGTYNSAGVANLTASMEKEPNTLSMNVAHVKGNPSESYVVEIYKDLAAIETHRKSDHYQAFVNEVGSKLTNRKMYDVQSVLLFEKKDALSIRYNDNINSIWNVPFVMMWVIRLVMCFVKETQKIAGTSFRSIAIRKPLLNT